MSYPLIREDRFSDLPKKDQALILSYSTELGSAGFLRSLNGGLLNVPGGRHTPSPIPARAWYRRPFGTMMLWEFWLRHRDRKERPITEKMALHQGWLEIRPGRWLPSYLMHDAISYCKAFKAYHDDMIDRVATARLRAQQEMVRNRVAKFLDMVEDLHRHYPTPLPLSVVMGITEKIVANPNLDLHPLVQQANKQLKELNPELLALGMPDPTQS